MISSKLTGLAFALLLALQLTVAQPHGKRHNRRDDGTYTTTKTVYVDQNGNTLDPAVYGQPQTPPPIASPTSPTAITPRSPIYPTPDLDTSGLTGKGVAVPGGAGIVYSPYNNDGTCKSASVVLSDITDLHSKGFGVVRLYGVDCQQVQNALAAVKPLGMKLFLGVYNMGQCATEVAQLILAVGGNWGSVYAVSVGNEQVNSGAMSAVGMVNLLNESRGTLRAAGFQGNVVTVDTWVAIIANPILCQNSDFVAANCHPFFDGGVTAANAGQFMSDSIAKIQAACPGKQILITETGWPHQGNSNGKCVPGIQEQYDALSSIHKVLGSNCIYFTAKDDMWKQDNPATANAERYWGIVNFSALN